MLRSLAGYRAAMARLARIVIPGAPHHVTQRSHLAGRRAKDDPLTDVAALGRHVPNWRAMLRHGLEAGGADAAGDAVAEAIEARLRTGRPLAAAEWIARQESATGRRMAPAKRGPKPKSAARRSSVAPLQSTAPEPISGQGFRGVSAHVK